MNLYITPAEAFELSDCSDRDAFYEELNRLLGDGLLSSISRRNESGSLRENTPPHTWIDCYLSVRGMAARRYPERIRPEHQAPRALIGADLINGTDCLPVDRIDVHFLRADFLAVWKGQAEPVAAPSLGARLRAVWISICAGLTVTNSRRKGAPLQQYEREALKDFLQQRQHANRREALEDARPHFPGVPFNEKTITELRAELDIEGKPGRKKELGN